MSPEKEKELYDKYPKIFQQTPKNTTPKSSCMFWGLECGEGWYELIDTLCHDLQFHIDHNKDPQIVAQQVKEKFGGLRFYTNSPTPMQRGMISMVESLSFKVCEMCGTNQKVTTDGERWIKTLCPDCRTKREEKLTQ